MKLTRAQKRARLEKAAQALIERLLDWEEANQTPNLTQIEDEVLALRQQFGQAMVSAVVAGQEAQQPSEAPRCPSCGAVMRPKGRKRKAVESRLGVVALDRAHYHCARCESGLFPPGPPT
jgi:DNA repair exonuclease SbcCD ATPase subunit